MKLGASQEVCRGSEFSPMMGDTPYGLVARRTGPSRVDTLRGRATHAPADVRALYSDTGQHYIRLGRRPGATLGLPDDARGRGRLAGRAVLDKTFSTILIEDSGFGLTKNELANNLGTISIENSGFGMTKNELVNNFGTIAKSGTKAFLEAMSASGVISIIGQFGVGFSSANLVSDKFRVVSKSFEDVQYIWESAAGVSFTMQNDTEMVHGGQARHEDHLLLEEVQSEFLEERRLKDLVSDNTQEHTTTHNNTQEQQEQHYNTTTLQHNNTTTTTPQQHDNTQQQGVCLKRAHCFVPSPFLMDPSEQPVTGGAQRRKAATTPLVVATRAAVDRCGPGHVYPTTQPYGDRRRSGPGRRRAS